MLQVKSHLDNISYSFKRASGKKRKIDLNWTIINSLFHKYGEVETSQGKISKYKYYDRYSNTSYKIFGNIVTISLAKGVFSSYLTKKRYYTHLVNAIQFLFDNEILMTPRKDTRQAAYYLLRSRGKVEIEHSLDIYGLSTSKQQHSIDSKGKRYQREHFTRFEVIVSGTVNKYREQLKRIKLTSAFTSEVIKKHTKNLLSKASDTLITCLIGKQIGKNRQYNIKKVSNWVKETIDNRDYSLLRDIKAIKKLIYLERQNII